MGDQRNNRLNWEVAGFDSKKSSSSTNSPQASSMDFDDYKPVAPLVRRYSISAASALPHSELPKHALTSKLQLLKDRVQLAKEDYMELRQEASELQEYFNSKLFPATRYLGVLAEKTRKLDQFALETEARIAPLISEKRRLFNDMLTAKGNIRVVCRMRPLFEDEGPSIVEYPDDCTVRVNSSDDSIPNAKRDFEFDRVYGPHVGQAELFNDVQPLVQSSLDGYNVSIFSYGHTNSGKTYTMEGCSHDCGLCVRCFEELFDLANSDSSSTSQFKFSVTVFEIYNNQIRDLLSESRDSLLKICMGSPESLVELVQGKVDNPLDFSKVLTSAYQIRGNDKSKFNVSHLYCSIL